MKALSIFSIIITVLLYCSTSFAQAKKTEIIKVWGNCEMCTAKIEKAAKSAGAATAKWDEETKELSVSFTDKKTSSKKIQQAIAKAGYDTQDFTGDDKAYSKLPMCCQYDRKVIADNKE
ncbi:MAG: cation transporter [Chitinophagaceae bacterium]|nr:cation transporter [Chitinophagaceae bacterium]